MGALFRYELEPHPPSEIAGRQPSGTCWIPLEGNVGCRGYHNSQRLQAEEGISGVDRESEAVRFWSFEFLPNRTSQVHG